MRVPYSLFSGLIVAAGATLAFADATLTTSEPVLGTPVLIGVDENQPGSSNVDFTEPVLGSVRLIAATAGGDFGQVSTAASATMEDADRAEANGKPRRIADQSDDGLRISVRGPGYVRVQLPNGEFRYLRRGTFKMDSAGRLVTLDGYPLHPQIKVPADALTVKIGRDGAVVATIQQSVGTITKELGQVQIVKFANPKALSRTDRVYFAETAESGSPMEGIPGSDGWGTLRSSGWEANDEKVLAELLLRIIVR